MLPPSDPSERRGFILCWAASKHPEWKAGIVERLAAVFPGEPILDDGGRTESDSEWRVALATAIGGVRAILLVIERRAILRAELQPPGYDWADDLLPRELHAVLSDRNYQFVPLLLGGAEIPPFGRLPADLKPLAMRRSISIASRSANTNDFTLLDRWLLNLAEGMSGSIAIPAPPGSGPPPPAATILIRPPPRPAPVVVSVPPPLPLRVRRARWPLVATGGLLVLLAGGWIYFAQEPSPSTPASGTVPPPAVGVRALTVREALALRSGAVNQRILIGAFTVTASGGRESVLRPIEREHRDDVRLTVRHPPGRALPAVGATLRLTAADRLAITQILRGADGHWIITVQAP